MFESDRTARQYETERAWQRAQSQFEENAGVFLVLLGLIVIFISRFRMALSKRARCPPSLDCSVADRSRHLLVVEDFSVKEMIVLIPISEQTRLICCALLWAV